MAKISKKLAAAKAKIDSKKIYTLEESIKLVKETSFVKFDASIDLVFTLNLDVRKVEQQLRGSIELPHGTGKKVRILAATDKEEEALAVGADLAASGQELTTILKKGKFDFDVIVAHPKMMLVIGKFGKDLGPKGLMPNPKVGTVTPNVSKAIQDIKKGKANYRTDKNGIVHTLIGKVSMDDKILIANAQKIIETIKKLKPSVVKGTYIKNLTISSSMGPSIIINPI